MRPSSPTSGWPDHSPGPAAVTLSVGGEHVAALRAFLAGDDAAFGLIGGLLDEDGSWQAYGLLQAAALAVAARRRFPDGYQAADVIRFVGRTRAALGDKADQIDPGTAERLLRAVLSDPAQAAAWTRTRQRWPPWHC